MKESKEIECLGCGSKGRKTITFQDHKLISYHCMDCEADVFDLKEDEIEHD